MALRLDVQHDALMITEMKALARAMTEIGLQLSSLRAVAESMHPVARALETIADDANRIVSMKAIAERETIDTRVWLSSACECGCELFVPGGPIQRWETSPGVDPRPHNAGAAVRCIACGKPYATSPTGLRRIHPEALPPHWRQTEMMKTIESLKEQLNERRSSIDREGKRQAQIHSHEGFSLPPNDD